MTAATKVTWAKLARAILPCTASGTPPPRKAAAAAVVTAAASTPTENVARGNVLADRDRARPTVTPGDVEVTVDIDWFLSLTAVPCAPLTMSTNGEDRFDTWSSTFLPDLQPAPGQGTTPVENRAAQRLQARPRGLVCAS